jgi:hypothetical protein
LNLEKILFSETIAAIISEPEIFPPRMELMEIEVERDSCYCDEYLPSFLY